MAKDYYLEVVEDEKWKLPRVRVHSISNEHYVNTFADLSEGHDFQKMAEWCIENDCGYRTSYNEFVFRTQEQITMFILRWS